MPMSWNIREAAAYYKTQGAPGDSGAVIALLREIQQENGGSIPRFLLEAAAAQLEVKESFFLALIRRIPSLRLADTHCLELCAGPNCGKRAALAEFVEKTYGIRPEKFTWRTVPCMRLCGKGPNIRWDGRLYSKADEALLRELIEKGTGGDQP